MQPSKLAGKRFGQLLVVERQGSMPGGQTAWLCLCDCGNKHVAAAHNLKSGNVKSCGCGQGVRHGGRFKPEYKVWCNMKVRCYNPKATDYKYWGGRGITVCERWRGKDGFKNFLADMGPRPKGLTLDRINTNGNYEPANCRWATWLVQSNNRRGISTMPEATDKD